MPLWGMDKQALDINHVLIIDGHGLGGLFITTSDLYPSRSGIRCSFHLIFLAVNQIVVCMIKLHMSIGRTHIYSPVAFSHYNRCYSDKVNEINNLER